MEGPSQPIRYQQIKAELTTKQAPMPDTAATNVIMRLVTAIAHERLGSDYSYAMAMPFNCSVSELKAPPAGNAAAVARRIVKDIQRPGSVRVQPIEG